MYRKLIDHKTILNDIVNNVSPIFFDLKDIDRHRTSIFGLQSEWNARAVEDTILLEQNRAVDYCPELSTNEIHVRQTAIIRNVPVITSTPATCYAQMSILKDDIHTRGISVSTSEKQFIIDKRSHILNNGIPFSLENDILIREICRKDGSYVYTANYTGDNLAHQSYIQVFDDISKEKEEIITLVVILYQRNFNIQEKIVTNELEFLIDGIEFDYENKLAGFEVFYKRPGDIKFTKIDTVHHLVNENSGKVLYHDDDDRNLLIIKNNEFSSIGINTVIRVEIQETLGTDGMISVGSQPTSFDLFKDNSYSYSGVNINIELISDPANARDEDTLDQLKNRLIREKTMRNNITTMLDVINFINDGYADYGTADHNIQVVKKRNDYYDCRYYVYSLLRIGDVICPTSTKSLIVFDNQFDVVREVDGRKCIKANHKYKINVVNNDKADYDYITIHDGPVPLASEPDNPKEFFVNIPFLMVFDKYSTMSYYFNSIRQKVPVSISKINDKFPYQIIAKECLITRDAIAQKDDDIYHVSIEGTLNTSNDLGIIDEAGNIADKTRMFAYAIFQNHGVNVAYLVMPLTRYDPTNRNRSFTFEGSFKTNDFITEDDKLEIIDGLYKIGSDKKYDSVIDFKDGIIQIGFMYNETGEDDDSETYSEKGIYSAIPDVSKYTEMNVYSNDKNNPYNLIIEMSKITSSPVVIERADINNPYPEVKANKLEEGGEESPQVGGGTELGDVKYRYTVKEAPLVEYEFSKTYIHEIYDEIMRMYVIYNSLIKKTTNFDISLKFIATYGPSKYIITTGGRDSHGNEIDKYLRNLNPTFRFRVYSMNPNVEGIKEFIYEYLRDTYITPENMSDVMESTITKKIIFMSNICTLVEKKFPSIRSIKYLGVDEFDASYQQFTYNRPEFTDVDGVIRYIPEQFNVTDIRIDIEETR